MSGSGRTVPIAITAIAGISVLLFLVAVGVILFGGSGQEDRNAALTSEIEAWEPSSIRNAAWRERVTGFEDNGVVVHIETTLYPKTANKPLAALICNSYAPYALKDDKRQTFMVMSKSDTVLAKCGMPSA